MRVVGWPHEQLAAADHGRRRAVTAYGPVNDEGMELAAMCNECEEAGESSEKNVDEMTEDERKAYEEWFEMVSEIRMKIDL